MNKNNKRITLRWISGVTGVEKVYIGILLLVQILLGISSVFYAIILKNIVDEAVVKNHSGFFLMMGIFAGMIMLRIILMAIYRSLEEYSRASMENRFKDRLFSSLLNTDLIDFNSEHTGEWMNRLTSDTVVVAEGFVQILPGLAETIVKLVGALVLIIIMEPVFGYFIIPGGVLLIVFTYGFRKKLKELHKQVQEEDGRLRIYLQESLGSMVVVRAFVKEEQMLMGAARKMENHKRVRMKRNRFSNIANIGFGSVMQGAYVLGAGFCGYGILNGTMTYGTLMAVMQLISQIQTPFANITGFLPRYYAMLASAERLMEVEALEEDKPELREIQPSREIPQLTNTKTLTEIHELYSLYFDSFIMDQVYFTYKSNVNSSESTRPITLRDFSLEIKKGDYIAFTGPSGCGKSTAIKLLMCLYQLDAGNIWIKMNDGIRLPLTLDYRRFFAYVPQENHFISGTIREIVAFSEESLMQQEERIWEALKIACAEEFVKELAQGIDTFIGERGLGLSEGQLQRISIARAICSNNPVLLLDESTSALDPRTEEELLFNLRSMTDRTVLIVTHRTNVLKICNKELVFSDDKVQLRHLI